MKILVDVGVGKAVESWLRSQGHNVLSVRDESAEMSDTDVLGWAVQDGRLIITMDKDFGELIHRSKQPHQGVLLLRLAGARATEKVSVIQAIFADYETKIAGKFSVYYNGRLRISRS